MLPYVDYVHEFLTDVLAGEDGSESKVRKMLHDESAKRSLKEPCFTATSGDAIAIREANNEQVRPLLLLYLSGRLPPLSIKLLYINELATLWLIKSFIYIQIGSRAFSFGSRPISNA